MNLVGTGYHFIQHMKADLRKEKAFPFRELQRLHLLRCRSLFPLMPLLRRRPKCLAGSASSAERWTTPDLISGAAATRVTGWMSRTGEPNGIHLSESDSDQYSRANTTSNTSENTLSRIREEHYQDDRLLHVAISNSDGPDALSPRINAPSTGHRTDRPNHAYGKSFRCKQPGGTYVAK